MAATESTRVVNAALVGNLLVALTKVAAALVTGSSAMRSEAVHSAVDTGNELLLLYGLRKAARPPDRVRKAHPEVVSLLIKPQKPERADFTASAGHDDEG